MVMSYIGQHARVHDRNLTFSITLLSNLQQMLLSKLTTVLYIPLSTGHPYTPVVIFTGSCLFTKPSLVCPPPPPNTCVTCCKLHLLPTTPVLLTIFSWKFPKQWLHSVYHHSSLLQPETGTICKKSLKLDKFIPKSTFKDSILDILNTKCICLPTH